MRSDDTAYGFAQGTTDSYTMALLTASSPEARDDNNSSRDNFKFEQVFDLVLHRLATHDDDAYFSFWISIAIESSKV